MLGGESHFPRDSPSSPPWRSPPGTLPYSSTSAAVERSAAVREGPRRALPFTVPFARAFCVAAGSPACATKSYHEAQQKEGMAGIGGFANSAGALPGSESLGVI